MKELVSRHILIINPGSTSTKTALFDGDQKVAEEVVRHDPNELARFDAVVVVPGEFEMEALAAAGIRYLSSTDKLQTY